jgi:hypothetical protein
MTHNSGEGSFGTWLRPVAARRWTVAFSLVAAWLTGSVVLGADPSSPPGVVVDHRPASSREYCGSPSLARLADGSYVASHDLFGPGSTLDRTVVFTSVDRGRSWSRLVELTGQWWSSLFLHREALYLMGTSRENGEAVVRRSTDGGKTWTTPLDAHSGLLIAGGRYHCAPVPVVVHRGRIWRAMEDAMGPGGWGTQFHAFMMSAPESADLLESTNWTVSTRLGRDPEWLDGKFGGWLEGNAVVDADGGVLDILRVDYRNGPEKAALVHISADGKTASFDAATGFVDFPGGCKKFTIRKDPAGLGYWSLADFVPEKFRGPNPERTRNTLALVFSPDLRRWTVRSILLHHPDPSRHGFQYADWQFEGKDLVALVRTAFEDDAGGAHNQHDANFITFHRVTGFRELSWRDSPVEFRNELSRQAQ